MKNSNEVPQRKKIAMGGGETEVPVGKSRQFKSGGAVDMPKERFKDEQFRGAGNGRNGFKKGGGK